MNQDQSIINSDLEAYKKDSQCQSSTSKYITQYSQDENDKISNNKSLNSNQQFQKNYKGSPAKPNHQPSNSIGGGESKIKQLASKSFHSQNLVQPQFQEKKTLSGEKSYMTHSTQKSINSPIINGFFESSSSTYRNINEISSIPNIEQINTKQYSKQQNTLSPGMFAQKEMQNINQIASNNLYQENNDTFKVYSRVRPINAKEKSQQNPKRRLDIIKTYNNTMYVQDPEISRSSENQKGKNFTFDMVFGEKDDNQKVYEDHLLEGYNTTIFAYGQTGAGKTYTLFGDEYKHLDFLEGRDIMAEDLFKKFEQNQEYKYTVKVSYLEIYNENIRDLLVEQENQSNLMIVEDPQKGILIPELSEFQISESSELNNLIRKGNSIRVMASTQSNQFSSRSHCIIQINIEKTHVDIKYSSHKIVSKLSLIDLAGSERAAVSENKGIRMMEGSKINRSLLALGNCINILSDSKKQGAYVPYRDSKLTRLLKDSLGGTTKTVMIACVAPSFLTYEETINTLKYAQRAKNIQNKIKQNIVDVDIHVSQYKQIIDNLKVEIESLKKQLSNSVKKDQEHNHSKTGLQSIIVSSDPNIMQINDEKKENTEIEELSGQIFLNIEENWEITQTLRDLEQLRCKNQEILLKKSEEYNLLQKTTMNEEIQEEISKLLQEIQDIQNNMQNNDKVFQELQGNLEKNNTEKKLLREKIKQIVDNSENGQEKTLEETCKLLQLEKMDLCTQNIEIKKEAQTLALEKEKTVSKLKQMEREMEIMKQQLQEKDKIISKSSVLINQLKQKEQQQQSKQQIQQQGQQQVQHQAQKKSISNINQNLLSPQFSAATASSSRKVRDKSASAANQDTRGGQQQSQAVINTQEKSPNMKNQNQEVYFHQKVNRQLSNNHLEQQRRKKQYHSGNLSQANLQQKNQCISALQVKNDINQITQKEKQLSPKGKSNNKGFNTNQTKQQQNKVSNEQDIKKEYYYFDSNKKLQKRSEGIEEVKTPSQNELQQIANSVRDNLQKQEQNEYIKQNNQEQKNIQTKQNKGLNIDLDSLKKFDEIQKLKTVKKGSEQQKKNQNLQEGQVLPQKPKQKKKNKHKQNQLDEKISIDDLKNYASKIKDMDFEHVKIKPNLKKFQKVNDCMLTSQAPNKNQMNQVTALQKQNSQQYMNSPQQINPQQLLHSQTLTNSQQLMSSQQLVNSQLILNSQMLINQQQISNEKKQQFINELQQNNNPQISSSQRIQNLEQSIFQNLMRRQESLSNQKQIDSTNQQQLNTPNINTHQNNQTKNTVQSTISELQINKQGSDYEKEINSIQEKIVETQQLISSLKVNNNGYKQNPQYEQKDVMNPFESKNQQIYDEYSIVDKNLLQKQSYYKKTTSNNIEMSSDGKDFENYLSKIDTESKQNDDQNNKFQQELVPINDISCLNQVFDNSVDQTIQDFIYNFERVENNNNTKNNSNAYNQAHFHLVIDPKYQTKNQQQTQQQKNLQSTPEQNKLNIKSLDEVRVKIRLFKHQLNTLNEKIKNVQVNPDMINQMKNLLQQYEEDQYSLSHSDENIIKEFKRILIVLKEYKTKKSLSNTNNNLNLNTNFSSTQKNYQSIAQSNNPSSINQVTVGSQNQTSQYTTRPRSINSIGEESALQSQYYQQNNFNSHFNKKENQNQVSQSNINNYHTIQGNISVGKKQIEQGAFSKISSNYGEAAKVIHSSQLQNSNNSNIKRYSKSIQQVGEVTDTSRKTGQQSKKHDYKSSNNRQTLDFQTQNYQNISEIENNVEIHNINENQKILNDIQLKNNEKNSINNNPALNQNTSQHYISNSNQSSNRGKSATSYIQINNKRKSFKEDNEKSDNNNSNKQDQLKQLSTNVLNKFDHDPNIDQIIA